LADCAAQRAVRAARNVEEATLTGVDPHLVDFALAAIALEALALLGWRAVTGGGPAPLALLANLGAGAALLIVARATLAGAGAQWIATGLAVALAAHFTDLAARWRAAPVPQGPDKA